MRKWQMTIWQFGNLAIQGLLTSIAENRMPQLHLRRYQVDNIRINISPIVQLATSTTESSQS